MATEKPSPQQLAAVTVATWVYVLHASGVPIDDVSVSEACAAIAGAADSAVGDQAGGALVAALAARLPDESPAAVDGLARGLFGGRVRGDLGAGSRDERLTEVRKYQFNRSLPWLARIWERQPGAAKPAPTWLIVERVTEHVAAMDPNPWNAIDEERSIPVNEFQVLWELDNCTSLCLA